MRFWYLLTGQYPFSHQNAKEGQKYDWTHEPIQVKVFSRFLGLFQRKFAKNPQKSDETVLLG
jgi:hypothetical protein